MSPRARKSLNEGGRELWEEYLYVTRERFEFVGRIDFTAE